MRRSLRRLFQHESVVGRLLVYHHMCITRFKINHMFSLGIGGPFLQFLYVLFVIQLKVISTLLSGRATGTSCAQT